jgi:peptidoglycan hydrolase-like protein with peptidoglycan-binding domain
MAAAKPSVPTALRRVRVAPAGGPAAPPVVAGEVRPGKLGHRLKRLRHGRGADRTRSALKHTSVATATLPCEYLLRARGHNLTMDGIFGPKTDAAVRAFQQALHQDIPSVTVDGIVGPVTWRALVSGMLSF